MDLLLVGSVAFDSVKTPYGMRKKALGGSAVYASIAASNFCKPAIIGVVGTDFKQENIELLHSKNIDTLGLDVKEGDTFFWKGVYNDLNCAETLETRLNVFSDFAPEIPGEHKNIEYVLLGNIHPALQLSVLEQMQNSLLLAADTMNFWIDGERELLEKVIKKVDILFINEEEIKMLTGCSQILAAIEAASKMGPKILVIKRGEYGAICAYNNLLFFTSIFPVKKVIDPTGAGDSFAGGFMGYLSQQKKLDEGVLKKAMIYGTVLASFNVESFSIDRINQIDLEMIEDRLMKIRRSVIF